MSKVTLTEVERDLLAFQVFGGASPSPLLIRAVEDIVASRLQAAVRDQALRAIAPPDGYSADDF